MCILFFSLVIICSGRQINPHKNVYWWWNSKRTIAFKAIARNDYPTFYRMLKKGFDVNSIDDKNNSLLNCAIGASRFEMVVLLLHKGADPNNPDNTSLPLIRAAQTGRIDICKKLLKFGADPSLTGRGKDTALIAAVENGNYTLAKIFLKAGINPNLMSDSGSALYIASRSYSIEMIELLLRYGAKVNVLYRDKSALSAAVRNGYKLNTITKAKILLEAGAKVDLFKNNLLRIAFPLYLAVKTGNTELVELLISHGADVNQKIIIPVAMSCQFMPLNQKIIFPVKMSCQLTPSNKQMKVKAPVFTPLSAAIKNKYLPMVKLLLKHGAKATAKQYDEIKKMKSPGKAKTLDLFKIFYKGRYNRHDGYNRYELIKIAIAAGADVNALNHYRRSLLERIDGYGYIDLIRLLLKHGAKYKSEALRGAVRNGNIYLVKLLLKHGANPNLVSRTDRHAPTAIFYLGKNATSILPLLLKARADIKQLNNEGKYAFSVVLHESLIKTKLSKAGKDIAESILRNDDHEQKNHFIKILLDQGADKVKIRKLAKKYNKKNLLFLLDNVWIKGD